MFALGCYLYQNAGLHIVCNVNTTYGLHMVWSLNTVCSILYLYNICTTPLLMYFGLHIVCIYKWYLVFVWFAQNLTISNFLIEKSAQYSSLFVQGWCKFCTITIFVRFSHSFHIKILVYTIFAQIFLRSAPSCSSPDDTMCRPDRHARPHALGLAPGSGGVRAG